MGVWSKEKYYEYRALFIDSAEKIYTKEKIILHPTEKIWDLDSQQTLINIKIEFNPTDSAKLSSYSPTGIKRGWQRNYFEGVIENNKKIWMHPIRVNQYKLTEVAPFPEIIFPIKKDSTWKSGLWIGDGWGNFEGTIETRYIIVGKELRNYDFGFVTCWKVEAVAIHDKLGTSFAQFYFCQDYGFTEMNYQFFNQQKIEFKLKELRNKN